MDLRAVYLQQSLKSRVYFALLLTMGILVLGVCGFMVIEGYSFLDALYMTFITVSTVGFGLMKPLSAAGKVFLIVLISLNLAIITYAVSIITTYFFDGEYIENKKKQFIRKKIMSMSQHAIICGFGRNGRQAALMLQSRGIPFVVIEADQKHIQELKSLGFAYVEGDATHDRTLLAAHMGAADSLITTLPDDAQNLFVVLTAREMNPKIKIVSRASADSSVKKLKMAGADHVIMPDKLGGSHMAGLLIKPDIIEFVDNLLSQDKETYIEEIFIRERNPICGKSVSEIHQSYDFTIVGTRASNGNYTVGPDRSFIIHSGMMVIVLGKERELRVLKT